jgi:hypothetical protein
VTLSLFQASIGDILALNDPLSGWEWDCASMTAREILAAVASGRLEERSWEEARLVAPRRSWTRFHVERIAWMMVNPIYDPIHLDVEVAEEDGEGWPAVVGGRRLRIGAGSHRLAAASVRGDETILFQMPGGNALGLLPTARRIAGLEAELVDEPEHRPEPTRFAPG